MRHLDLETIVSTLASATGKPHMAISCTSTGFVRALMLKSVPLSARAELSKTGQAIFAFDSFVEAALAFCDISEEIDTHFGDADDVTLHLVQANLTVRHHQACAHRQTHAQAA